MCSEQRIRRFPKSDITSFYLDDGDATPNVEVVRAGDKISFQFDPADHDSWWSGERVPGTNYYRLISGKQGKGILFEDPDDGDFLEGHYREESKLGMWRIQLIEED